VTLRTVPGKASLRRQRMLYALEEAFRAARIRFGMRIVHYAILGNHVHLIVEAEDREALARGMQGLAIRMARTINRVLRRGGGQVWADRYHSHVLKSRREAANALRYLFGNFARHAAGWGGRIKPYGDMFTSIRFLGIATVEDPVAAPATWLLRIGWRGGGKFLGRELAAPVPPK